jgi:hypothetical protein
MLSKIMKANSNLLIRKCFNNFSRFHMTTNSTKNEQTMNELHSYINTFTGKKFDRFEDSLVIDSKLLGKLNINKQYPVFKSNLGKKLIFKVLMLQLLMVVPAAFLFYYSLNWLKSELILYKFEKSNKLYVSLYSSLFLASIVILNLLRKNNLYKIWTYVQKVDLSKDLKTLQITTFTNRIMNVELKDVYLYYNFSSPYISHKSMSKVEDTLIFGIKNDTYIVPLENSTIQSKDLLSICLRGYTLKFKE